MSTTHRELGTVDQQELDNSRRGSPESQRNRIASSEKPRKFPWEEGIINSRGSLIRCYASTIYENAGFYSKTHAQSQI